MPCLNPHRAVFKPRAGHLERLAGTPLRQAALTGERDLLAARLRAHHFRRLISFRVSISRSRSATILFNFAFSASRARRLFTSAGSSLPNFCLHRSVLCSLTLCFLATSTTGLREPFSQVMNGPKNLGRSGTLMSVSLRDAFAKTASGKVHLAGRHRIPTGRVPGSSGIKNDTHGDGGASTPAAAYSCSSRLLAGNRPNTRRGAPRLTGP